MTPEQMFAHAIGTFEGGLSLQPADNGNWYDPARYRARLPQRRGCGVLVGSKCGVTAYAFAASQGTTLVTRETMARLTPAIAVEIGMALYFRRPNLQLLPWNRVTASVVDKGWGSGPKRVIERLQRFLGVGDDGVISPGGATIKAYAAWLSRVGEEAAARAWCAERHAWDCAIATNDGPTDPDRIFLRGWNARSDSFLPGTPFWASW